MAALCGGVSHLYIQKICATERETERKKDWTIYVQSEMSVGVRIWEMDNGIIQHKADDIFSFKKNVTIESIKERICCQAIKFVWKCMCVNKTNKKKKKKSTPTHASTHLNWILLNQFRMSRSSLFLLYGLYVSLLYECVYIL